MLRGVPTADHIPEVHCLLEHGKVSGEDKVTIAAVGQLDQHLGGVCDLEELPVPDLGKVAGQWNTCSGLASGRVMVASEAMRKGGNRKERKERRANEDKK